MPQFNVSPEDLADLVKDRDTSDDSAAGLKKQFGDAKELTKKLGSDPKDGIDSKEVEARQEHFGDNKPEVKKSRSFFSFFFDALKDRTLIILCVSSVVSIVLGVALPPPGESRATGWIEGTAILIAVVVVASVTSINDYQKDRKFNQLSAAAEDRTIKVIRNGKQKTISTFDIVVGDVVQLETGDYIPADMVYIKGQDAMVDESAMTGEPEGVHKSDEEPYLLSNCMIMDGMARGVVIAVGRRSQWGQIKATLEKGETQTPLQKKLEDLAELIGKLGVAAAICTFIALVLKWSITTFGIDKTPWEWNQLGVVVNFLITSITIIVVAVPEGLPLAVTISLAYSMLQMMKDQNLVRHLAACETMGGATTICSDKTGTLTQNKMTVVKLWVAGKKFDEPPKKAEEIGDEKVQAALMEGMCVNGTAYLQKNDETGKVESVGAKTECALLLLAGDLGFDYQKLRDDNEVIKVYPFSSEKKRMSSVMAKEGGKIMHCKGASEVILDRCTKMMNENGDEEDMPEDKKKEFADLIEQWAKDGLRTLSLSYKDVSEGSLPDNKEGPDDDLTLLGIVGIEDPLRPEVAESVKNCQKAGITVRMLTGDNILTAKKIASRCGIFTEGGVAIEGPKFRNLSETELAEMAPKIQVIARCSPEDKLTLVKHLREAGEVVAVTGDGTNDAPQLREADVGFAMGISGTEVAKEACDIVLLDDNFSSIEKAVMWGRNVYDSIRKFIQFQVTVNLVAVTVAFTGSVTTGESPLTAVQLLWVNLIMDTMAALALATEPPTRELMNRRPYGRNSPLITRKMWRMIIGQGLYQLGVLFFCLYGIRGIGFLGFPTDDVEADKVKNTIVFNTFVFCQVFNEINSRKLEDEFNVFKGLLSSRIFLAVLFFTVTVQTLLVEFGGAFSDTVGLSLVQWAFCLAIGAVSLPLGMLLRCIPIKNVEAPKQKGPAGRKGKDEAEEPLMGSSSPKSGGKKKKVNKKKGKDEERDLEMQALPQSPKDNWRKAQKILTQVKVVSALRKGVKATTPHLGHRRSLEERPYTFSN